MSRLWIVSITVLSTMFLTGAELYAQRGGQGRIPTSPPAPQAGPRFPGFPGNAGIGRPLSPGRPELNIPRPSAAEAPSATDLLGENSKLKSRLEERLGGEIGSQCDGLSLGQCASGIMVSDNLDLDFAVVSGHLTDGMSLGEALYAVDGENLTPAEANQAASDAEDEADELIEENP